MILKIVSGGQSGADIGGLEAARDCGIQTGGWATKGYRTENGPKPSLARFGLIEHSSPNYVPRTVANVQDSDGTLLIGDPTSKGSAVAIGACERYGRPMLKLRWTPDRGPEPSEAAVAAVRAWAERLNIQTLNVAGNRESIAPGIGEATYSLIAAVLTNP